jgi:hypothetical protein
MPGHKMPEFQTRNLLKQLTTQAPYLYHFFNPPVLLSWNLLVERQIL